MYYRRRVSCYSLLFTIALFFCMCIWHLKAWVTLLVWIKWFITYDLHSTGHRLSIWLYVVGGRKNTSKPDLRLKHTAFTCFCLGCPTQWFQYCHILHITLHRHRCSLCVHCCLVMAWGRSTMRVCVCTSLHVCASLLGLFSILFELTQSRHADIVIIRTDI